MWLWYQPPSAWALAVAMVLENFTGAIGTVIFIAYISALCRNPLHTATQYALLTALASAGRTVFASGTGFVVDAIGWPAFFVATALAALPALALLAWLQRRGISRRSDAQSDPKSTSPVTASVGWVERSDDPTPGRDLDLRRVSASLDPTYNAPAARAR